MLQAAEEDYEEPEHLYNDAGIPFEPFHMKNEREEGYFDAESGSYIRVKKKEDIEDVWADTLAREEVNSDWARGVQARIRSREHRQEVDGGDSGELTPEAIAELKRRMVSLLRPEENVLSALRRLGRARAPIPMQGSHTSQRLSAGGISLLMMRAAAMAPEAQSEFDRLTEWSSTLMEAGEYLIHSQTREQLLEEIHNGSGGGGREGELDGLLIAQTLLKQAQVDTTGSTRVVICTTSRDTNGDLNGNEEERRRRVVQEAADDVDMFEEPEEREEENTPRGQHEDNNDTAATKLKSIEKKGATSVEQGRTKEGNTNRNESSKQGGNGLKNSSPIKEQSPAISPPPPPPAAGARNNDEENLEFSGSPSSASTRHWDTSSSLQGFVFDDRTGYFYNSTLGAYYDPNSSLFGDAASGRWYSLDRNTGQYIAV